MGNNSPLKNGYRIIINFPSDYTYINYNTMICKINNVIYTCSRVNSTYHTLTITVQIMVNAIINTITSV